MRENRSKNASDCDLKMLQVMTHLTVEQIGSILFNVALPKVPRQVQFHCIFRGW